VEATDLADSDAAAKASVPESAGDRCRVPIGNCRAISYETEKGVVSDNSFQTVDKVQGFALDFSCSNLLKVSIFRHFFGIIEVSYTRR
jgi:hypothetical protein